MLASAGILSFVLPNSFNNASYYNLVRKHIFNNYTIVNITDHSELDLFSETKQNVSSFIIQKTPPIITDEGININTKYSIVVNDETIIFNDPNNITKLKSYLETATNLNKLKCIANTGKVVWNQVKEHLTDTASETLLIYSGNISKKQYNEVVFKNEKKKNYILTDKCIPINEPIIVINRGYGNAKYKFNYALINLTHGFQVENHLICVRCNDANKTNDEKLQLLTQIVNSFDDKRTTDFINLYCNNNALSNNEIINIVPIYL